MMDALCPQLSLKILTLYLLIFNVARLNAEQCRVLDYQIVSEG